MIEAMKQALEALENWKHAYPDEFDEFDEDALKAIKETLAQPEQELLAWKNAALRVGEDLSSIGPNGYYNMTAQQWLDWAMAQQPRGNNSLAQPEQERCEYCKRGLKTMCLCGMKAQPEQEPCRHRIVDIRNEAIKSGYMCMDCGALFGAYATPPQRTWVGLTDEDKKQIAKEANYNWEMTTGEYAERIGRLTEAKLKEKNT